jgi:hypothetical protein
MGLFNWFFTWVARRAFRKVDHDGNGKLDPIEVEVAILQLYNVINKRLPGWQDPPSSRDIKKAMDVFGAGGMLDEAQFVLFARDLVKSGPDAFFSRVGRQAVLRTGILPGVTYAVKRYAGEALKVSGVPSVVLAPAIGTIVGAARGLLPWG